MDFRKELDNSSGRMFECILISMIHDCLNPFLCKIDEEETKRLWKEEVATPMSKLLFEVGERVKETRPPKEDPPPPPVVVVTEIQEVPS